MREGAENGDPKHLRDVEALGNICAMIDRGVLLFVDEGVIEKEPYNFRESEHYFGFRVCVWHVVKSPKKKKRNKKLRAEQLSFLLSLSLSACCLFLLLVVVVVVLLLRP